MVSSSHYSFCLIELFQFGVDVVENSRKVTHGCIIATLKLYLPDGKEAKASPTIVSSVSSTSLPTQDLYQLHHYIQVNYSSHLKSNVNQKPLHKVSLQLLLTRFSRIQIYSTKAFQFSVHCFSEMKYVLCLLL